MNELKEKLKTNIKYHIDRVAKTGSSSFSTCDHIVDGIKIFGIIDIPSLTN